MNRLSRMTLATLTLVASFSAHAGSFDDAVNHYLTGFEECQAANKALQANDLTKARAKMQAYERIFGEAKAIDASIAHSKERNMEGNIVVCKRIATDIGNKAGMPVMERAIAECKAAEAAIEGGNPEQANGLLDSFRSLRDEALGASPGLRDIFAISNQLGRCERLENKIGRVAAKQEAEDATVNKLVTNSKTFVDTCNAATQTLAKGKVDDATLRAVNIKIGSAQQARKGSLPGPIVTKIFANRPDHPGKATIDANLKTGDACLASLQKQVAAKTTELAGMKRATAQYDQEATRLVAACDAAKALAEGEPSQANHDNAKKQADEVTSNARQLSAKAGGDANWRKARDMGLTTGFQRNIDTSTRCAATVAPALKTLQAALKDKAAQEKLAAELAAKKAAEEKAAAEAAAKAKADAEAKALAAKAAEAAKAEAAAKAAAAKAAAAEATAGAAGILGAAGRLVGAVTAGGGDAPAEPESGIFGTLTLKGETPSHAILLFADGSKAPSRAEAEIAPAGFREPVVIVSPGGTLEIKNNDNGMRRVSATAPWGSYEDTLPMMQSRTRKALKASWPANTAVEIKTENARQTPVLAFAVQGGRYEVLSVKSGNVEFKLPDNAPKKAVLLVPGFDAAQVDFSSGKVDMALTRGGKPSGQLTIVKR